MSTTRNAALSGAVLLGLIGASASAQTVTTDDYRRADSFLGNAQTLVDHSVQRITWIDDGHFWYRDHDRTGDQYLVVDAATGSATRAFDRDKVAAALTTSSGKKVDPAKLPVSAFTVRQDGGLDITSRGKHYVCDQAVARCDLAAAKKDASGKSYGDEPGLASPDGKSEAFIRDWNLWVRDVASGAETQLTTDGTKDFGYATDNAGWKHTDAAIVVWSPDSKKIATFQQDQRKTGEMTTVSVNVGHPKVDTWKYPLPGDKDVTMIERVVIDVPTKKVVRFKMPADQHRSTLCDDVSCSPGLWDDVRWSADGKSIAFVSTSRDHKQEWFRVANPETGDVRTVFDEKVKTYFESGNGTVNWQYVPETDQVIWFSERSNWGHLYMYSLKTGKLEQQITKGDWNVTEVLRIDAKTKTIWFRGVGREKGVNPYYQQFYKVGFDGKGLTLLTPENADHTVSRASRRHRCHGQGHRACRHLSPEGHWLGASHRVHGEGARRQDRSLRPYVQAIEVRSVEEVPAGGLHLSGSADGFSAHAQLHADAWRQPGACRTGLHRRCRRWHGHAVAFQGVPRRILREHR
jgi:dipeptidyl-peptidase-4